MGPFGILQGVIALLVFVLIAVAYLKIKRRSRQHWHDRSGARKSRHHNAASPDPQISEVSETVRQLIEASRNKPGIPAVRHSGVAAGPGVVQVQVQSRSLQHRSSLSHSATVSTSCPQEVVAGHEFTLSINITVGNPLRELMGLGEPAPQTFTLHVVADGFDLKTGEEWRREVQTSPIQDKQVALVHLTPLRRTHPREDTLIQTLIGANGQTVGFDSRTVAVLSESALLSDPTRPPESKSLHVEPSPVPVEDLTVRILTSDTPGLLRWTLESPHAAVRLPGVALDVRIGNDPAGFARDLIKSMNAQEGKPLLSKQLKGIGLGIADKMPPEFWTAFKSIADGKTEPPRVLILSQEPYVPWELAYVSEPPDPDSPPFLAAQALVGRWMLPERQRPRLPPPLEVNVKEVGVISGSYASTPDWERLIAAEQEAAEIVKRYGARAVSATPSDVGTYLDGGTAQVLHFAVHGNYDPGTGEDGLIMTTGDAITPTQIKGFDLRAQKPFVFLNACQVGSGSQMLGDYAGMAQSFLYAGASGVVAPLWAVNDTLAKDLALAFYDQIHQEARPAAILRRARAKLVSSGTVESSTYLAFQFFGHPSLKLLFPTEPPAQS